MCKITQQAIFSFSFILFISWFGYSQTDKNVQLELLSQTMLKVPTTYDAKFFVKENNQIVSSYFNFNAKCLTSETPSSDSIILPLHLDVLVSADGKTMLQYGERGTRFHPSVTDLYWVNENGESIRQIENRYKNNAIVKMSSDGFVAICGSPIFKGPDVITVYNPQGLESWTRNMEGNRRVADMIISNSGNSIALITTDNENWLEGHRLEIIKQEGQDVSIANNGILQKMKFIGNQEDVFVQAYDSYFLADQAFGEIKWKRNEKIRMASPSGVVASNNNQNIILAVVDWKGTTSEKYDWIIKTLDYTNGANTGEVRLPAAHASTWDNVFKEILSDKITIETIDRRYDFRIN